MVTLLPNNPLKTSPALALLTKIRTDLQELDAKILNHRYLDALEQGQVSELALLSFIGNQYHLTRSNLRAYAQMQQRFADTKFGGYFQESLQFEESAARALLLMAQQQQMTTKSLENFDIDPDALSYGYYVSWLADNASLAEILTAFAVNYPVWGANCQRMSRALRQIYGFSASQTRFLDLFSEASENETMILEAISSELSAPMSEERITRSVRLIQAYELRFWEAMAWTVDVEWYSEMENNVLVKGFGNNRSYS